MIKNFTVFFTAAVICLGCDSEQLASKQLAEVYAVQETQADDSSLDVSEDATSDILQDDLYGGPNSPVRVTIEEMKEEKSKKTAILTVTATNTTDVDLVVRAKISAVGLLAYVEEMVLSKKTLKVGKAKRWTVPVKSLPFESNAVITQLEASVQYKEANEDDYTGTFSSPQYYYLSDETEDEIQIFDEKHFFKEYKGKLKPKEDDPIKNNYLGKIKKVDGTIEEITSESIGVQIIDADGNVAGIILNEQEYDPRYAEEEVL